MLRQLCVVSLLSGCASLAAAADVVKIEKKTDSVAITIDGNEFTTYRRADSQPKPFFWPVRTADGAIMTRSLEKPDEHPHHKGMWCAVDEVNEIKFWAERGKIVNAAVEVIQANGNPARMRIINHWLGADGRPVLIERVLFSVYANRRVDYDVELAAGEQSVRFDDTKEGLFGIRVADSLRGQAGGKINNSEGGKGEKECWGKEAKWVDYVGQIDGKTYGVAIFDHPSNFRKSRFHVRDYGLFTLSPFGQKAYSDNQLPADPLTLEPGKSVRLRYGLYIHDGDGGQGRVAEIYEAFAKGN